MLTLGFFMLFSALKLIANTVNELALFFFSQDSKGQALMQIRAGSLIFVFGSFLSLIFNQSLLVISIIFVATCLVYFVYFIIKISDHLTVGGMFGMVFMILLFWATFVSTVTFIVLRVYHALLATLHV